MKSASDQDVEGKHRLDHKIWGIAWPAILSNLSIPLLGLVDSAILGHLSSSQFLGAVAIGAALLSFLYWGFSFLRMGTTGLVARAEGAGDQYGSIMILMRSGLLALVLAALVVLLHPLLLGLGMLLMGPSPELASLAYSYAQIRIASAPAVLLTYTVVGWCIGRQDTRWPMLIVITTNTANIGLDFLLIMGLGMNSDGAALATVTAEYLGCGMALFVVYRRLPALDFPSLLKDLLIASAYIRLLQSNRHLFVRTISLLFSFAFFTAMGEKFGSETLAANTLLIQLLMMAAYGMDGFAFAVEGLSGNALGRRDLDAFHAAVRRCAHWTLLSATAMSAALLVSQDMLVGMLTGIDSVAELMRRYYPWLVALPLVAAPSYLLDGVFIGSAETRHMMTTMLFSVSAVYLPLWYLCAPLQNHGLWLAFCAFNGARGLSLYIVYRRLTARGQWLPPG